MLVSRKLVSLCVSVFVVLMAFVFPLTSVSALTVPTLYADVNNGTQVTNMLNYAMRYDSFYNAKYIAFRDSANSYYLAWGDDDAFSISDNVVTSANCSYVRYYRQSNTSDWDYLFEENDTLSLACDKLVTTNLIGVVGFVSPTYDDWMFRTSVRRMGIVLGSLFIALGIYLAVKR